LRLRAELLPTDKIVNEAFDPYIMLRDAYKQRRAYLLNPETEEDQDEIHTSESTVSLVN